MPVSAETELFYKKKIDAIKKRYWAGNDPVSEKQILEAFKEIRKEGYCGKTLVMYRTILYKISERAGVKLEKGKMDIPTSEKKKKSRKRKSYEFRYRRLIFENLGRINSEYRGFIYNHLICGALVGYRLRELRGMTVKERSGMLSVRIKNGKYSEIRANGKYREVEISKEFIGLDIKKMLTSLISKADSFETPDAYYNFIKNASTAHGRLAAKLEIKGLVPTLTSVRHQYKINMKSVDDSAGELPLLIAASMGHKSIETHTIHYGINRGGRGLVEEEEKDFAKSLNVPVHVKDKVTNRNTKPIPRQHKSNPKR